MTDAAVASVSDLVMRSPLERARRFVIQHRTSRRYLAALPSIGAGRLEVREVINAARFTDAVEAERERRSIEHFPDAYQVVAVTACGHRPTPGAWHA